MRIPGPFFDVPKASRVAHCRSCTMPIYWVRMTSGKLMPIDCNVDGGFAPSVITDGKGLSHFATCPNATQHRRPK